MKEAVRLEYFNREGFDGETFSYVALRRKDGVVPQNSLIRRIYNAGYIDLGFMRCPPESREFVETFHNAGFEVDQHVLYLTGLIT